MNPDTAGVGLLPTSPFITDDPVFVIPLPASNPNVDAVPRLIGTAYALTANNERSKKITMCVFNFYPPFIVY
jgi:hypothetical protein